MSNKDGALSGGDIMRLMSYQAGIAVACATIIGFMITSGSSLGADKQKIVDNEERSKKNQADIAELKGNVREILVILRERKEKEDKKTK